MEYISACVIAVVCCILAALALHFRPKPSTTPTALQADPVAATRQGGIAGRATRLRRRQQAVPVPNVPVDDEDDGEEQEAEVPADTSRKGRLASKKAAKQAAKVAEREAREARQQDAAESMQSGHQSAYDAARVKKERDMEEAERAQDDEIRRAQEERQRKEEEEFNQWKGEISVEASGEAQQSQEQEAELRASIASYVKARKMSKLEEISAEFQMRTKEVIDHIYALEASGQLTGVMDDRGKYIYLSDAEMAAVVELMRSRGRIDIPSLSRDASNILDLEGKEAADPARATLTMSLDQLVEV